MASLPPWCAERRKSWGPRRRPRMPAAAEKTRYEDSQPSCVKCVPTIAKVFIKLLAWRNLNARGFKCSMWQSLAIWTWSSDPAASRPKNCSFNSIRRLNNPRMKVRGGGGGGRAFCLSDACAQLGDISGLFFSTNLTEVKLYEFFMIDGLVSPVSPARFCAAEQWAPGLQASLGSSCLLQFKINRKKAKYN